MATETHTLLADIENRRIGCVLLQAVSGCSGDLLYRFGFDTATWEVSPVSTLRRVTGTEVEWLRFAELCNVEHSGR